MTASPAETPVIFLAFANQQDAYLEKLRQERRALEQALKPAAEQQFIQLISEAEADGKYIFDTFNEYRGRIKIFHYAGHADGDHLDLVGQQFQGRSIADLIQEENHASESGGVELVFLNGCATYGQVSALLEAGVKRVIATSVAIADPQASTLAQAFYERLARPGADIEEAYRVAAIAVREGGEEARAAWAELGEIRSLGSLSKQKSAMVFPWALYVDEDQSLRPWRLPRRKVPQASSEKKIPRLLTAPPQKPPAEFRGREADFQDIQNLLSGEQSMLLLLNANGGIGKTTLASYFYQQEQERFNHIAWLYCEQGIATTMLSTLLGELGVEIHSREDEDSQAFQELIKNLARLSPECLLVLDNANDETDLKQCIPELSRLANFRILITSRCRNLDGIIPEKQITPLSQQEAISLFIKYYPPARQERELLVSLLERIGYNTLVLELLAKNLQEANKNNPNAYPLRRLCEDLEQKGLFGLSKRKKVSSKYHIVSGREIKPEEVVAAMYDIKALSPDEQVLLSQMALLPAQAISYRQLYEILGISSDEEDDFEETLRSLNQKGWVDFESKESQSFYKLSPVIQEVTLRLQKPVHNQLKKVIAYLNKNLESKDIHLMSINFQEVSPLAQVAQNILKHISHERTTDLGYLAFHLSDFYQKTGNLNRALYTIERSASILQDQDAEYYAICLARLGTIYQNQGNLEQAGLYYQKYHSTGKKLFQTKSQGSNMPKRILANSYERLGALKMAYGEYEEALGLYENYNLLIKELTLETPQSEFFNHRLAISYARLGEAYQKIDKTEEALHNFEKYQAINLELYDSNPESELVKNSLAVSLEKLGSIYLRQGKHEQALILLRKRNDIAKELYQANKSSEGLKRGLAISYEKLGSVYQEQGNYLEAMSNYEKEKSLFEELHEDNPLSEYLKKGLAISYKKIGSLCLLRGNIDDAKSYFILSKELFEELYQANSDSESIERGLDILNNEVDAIQNTTPPTYSYSYPKEYLSNSSHDYADHDDAQSNESVDEGVKPVEPRDPESDDEID